MDDVRAKAEKIWNKGFGGKLSNVYTYDRNTNLSVLGRTTFSKRYRVVIAMLEAMLHEEEMIRQEEINGTSEQTPT